MLITETDRLLLRLQTIDDAGNLVTMNSDPEVVRFTGDKSLSNTAEARELLEKIVFPQWHKYKMGRFAVTLKDGTYLGWCGLKFHPETNEVDLGYRFMKKFWGKGYATESSRASLDYGFKTLKLERILAKAMPDNKDSIKVMQKLGMTFRGYHHDPTDPHPFVLYDMKKEEWK
ncbi:MAG: GNAT family N-acetyltransferase [Bacteriovoracaceae bacterium]